MTGGLAGACLIGAAVVVAWPVRLEHARRRRLGFVDGRWPNLWMTLAGRLRRTLLGRGGVMMCAVAALGGVAGFVVGGPVAAVVSAGYCGVGVRAASRRVQARAEAQARASSLDALGALAADLRAGLPLPAASTVDSAADPLAARTCAAVSLAETTGAPLTDLLDRIEADARAVDRVAAMAAAQSAGARATAWLLAALPIAGIALGYAIGADPVHVLLRTPLGAACALAALALQLAGLAWSNRIVRLEVPR